MSDTVAGNPTDAALGQLRQSLRGEVIVPGDEAYDHARSVLKGAINRRPGVVARCAGVADVIEAVHFARTRGLLVAVRGGGHSSTATKTSRPSRKGQHKPSHEAHRA
jgi:FAD/FMN-containing dehydrogenase